MQANDVSTEWLNLWRGLGRLLLHWTLQFTAAGAVIYFLAVLAGQFFGPVALLAVSVALPLAAVVVGLVLGGAQRRRLAPYLSVGLGWTWATAIGLGLGLIFVTTVSLALRDVVQEWTNGYKLTAFLLGAGLSGALSALGQWLILRKSLEKHHWWMLASGVGWLMAWLGFLAVGLFLGGGEPLPVSLDRWLDILILGAVAGFFIGFEQGVAFVGLLAQRVWEKRKGLQ